MKRSLPLLASALLVVTSLISVACNDDGVEAARPSAASDDDAGQGPSVDGSPGSPGDAEPYVDQGARRDVDASAVPDAADAATGTAVLELGPPHADQVFQLAAGARFAVQLPVSGICPSWNVVGGAEVLGPPATSTRPPMPGYPGSSGTARFEWTAKIGTHVIALAHGPACSFEVTIDVPRT